MLFVGTNTGNTTAVKDTAIHTGMPFVTGRWPGGLLTNFSTTRNSIKGFLNLEDMLCNLDTWRKNKKSTRKMAIEQYRRKGNLDGLREMNKLPEALFVVDAARNKSSILEARRLGIEVFAICSSNADVNKVDNVVPGSVDSPMATRIFIEYITKNSCKTEQPFAYIHPEIGMSNAGFLDHVYQVKASIDVPDPDISVAALPSKHIHVLSCIRSNAYPIVWNIAFRTIERGKAYIEVDFFRSRCRVLTLTARFRIK